MLYQTNALKNFCFTDSPLDREQKKQAIKQQAADWKSCSYWSNRAPFRSLCWWKAGVLPERAAASLR